MSTSSVSSNQSYYYQTTQTVKTQITDNTTGTTTNQNKDAQATQASADKTTTTTQATTTTRTPATISTQWGFNVDDKGFFGVEFNKAAGLPENMKIHQTMMEKASEYSKARGDNVDPMTVVSKVWNLYKTVAGNTLDTDGDGYMTQPEVAKMPKSYTSKGSLLDGVVSVQKDNEEYFKKFSEGMTVIDAAVTTRPCLGIRGFSNLAIAPNDDPFTSFYGARAVYAEYATTYETPQPEDKLAVGELFGAFFYKQVDDEIGDYKGGSAVRRGDTVQDTKAYYKFLESGQDMKSYLANTQGKEYLAELSKKLNTKPDGTFDQSLADQFFEQLDRTNRENFKEYMANNYPSLEPTSSKETDKDSKSIKQAYGTSKNTKLPSGSLMNASV